MIKQDTEIVLKGDREAQDVRAKQLHTRCLVIGEDIPLITKPHEKKKDCALQLRSADDVGQVLQKRHIRYVFGFHSIEKPPLINQVTAKQFVARDITLLFPYPSPPSMKWTRYVASMLPILEKYKVKVRFVCLSKNINHMTEQHEKESFYRLMLEKPGRFDTTVALPDSTYHPEELEKEEKIEAASH